MSAPTLPPADWYPDPIDSSLSRWWSGSEWGTETRPAIRAEAAQAPAKKIPLFGARKAARELLSENERLAQLIDKYGLQDVATRSATLSELEREIAEAGSQLNREKAALLSTAHDRNAIAAEIVNLREAAELQEYGVFDYEHPAENSVALAVDLEGVRSQVRDAVKRGRATSATSNFTFNNSASKGRKFVSDMSKLLLRAYNAEAENCVKAVRAGNLPSATKRLTTAATQVERLGKMIDLRITSSYHGLRLRELELASQHMQALQVEKEMERARREELREQRKAEQELAREKARLEKERTHYLNVLASLQASGDSEGAVRLTAQLEDVDKAIADVDYRTANIRAGYVYVISNIGAFGPDVVKIGLTRRLEPMDRVAELGDASVPFRFDVHAMFFAQDAVSIESMLHQHFAEQRLNKVNLRREYFRATPAQVLEVLKEHNVEVLEYTLHVVNEEYRASQAN